MKRALVLILVTSSFVFAQDTVKLSVHTGGPGAGVAGFRAFETSSGTPVVGAPYSATISNELVQTLADGNRIIESSTGTTARDSQGRTRRDAVLPAIGNLGAANAPRLVFIQDPVAQTSYTLDLTDKTHEEKFFVQMRAPGNDPLPPPGIAMQKTVIEADEHSPAATEDLGSQTMEGVLVNGVRTTHTIPAGQVGNDRPIIIVTEVWTSPELKAIVYSKRTDPRMGEQTFQLKSIVRSEPDPSLFTVPADFKVVDGPRNFVYRVKQ